MDYNSFGVEINHDGGRQENKERGGQAVLPSAE